MNLTAPRTILSGLTFLLMSVYTSSCNKDEELFEEAIGQEIEENIANENANVITTIELAPTNDAYLQNDERFNEPLIRVEKDRRTGYLLFDLSQIEGEIEEVSLQFTVDSDSGDGNLQVFQGYSTNWSESDLSIQSAPQNDYLLNSTDAVFEIGQLNTLDLDKSNVQAEPLSIILTKTSGDDFALASKESSRAAPPKLIVTFRGTITNGGGGEEDNEEAEEENTTEGTSDYNPPCDYGGACMTPDYTCLDDKYPVIEEFIQAGVLGGIPENLSVVTNISPADDIQQAIDETHANGGGVILFQEGTYLIREELYMKSNVVLRGIDREKVRLESLLRGDDDNKTQTILFENTSYAGIENMTLFFSVAGYEPIDREGLNAGQWDPSLFSNDPHGLTDLYVTTIVMDSNSSNNWVDNCNILESGWHTVRIRGNNNTVRNSFIDRAYNKGGNGRGYFNIIGDYNLVVNNTIQRIRHVNIELGAQYNVVFNNEIFVDINFHDDDDGDNLIENNRILTPTYHPFPVFTTGGSEYGHRPPGPNNLWVNNTANQQQNGPIYSVPNTIYRLSDNTFDTVIETDWEMPTCNTFYPMVGQ